MQQRHHVPKLELLVELLDRVVREQVGDHLADVMSRIRRQAHERRAGLMDAEQRLLADIQRLEQTDLRAVIRWLTLFFDLANLAEDVQRLSALRSRDAAAEESGKPRRESIADGVYTLKQQGMPAAELQRLLDRLIVEPVFTAHPSEAKRRITRSLLRLLRSDLKTLASNDLLGEERQQVHDRMLGVVTTLWQSDILRPQRPSVMSEVVRGLFFAESLWSVTPMIYRDLRQALAACYPQHHFELPRILSFGTWIGGDRDGNPYVTAEVTAESLRLLRKAAIERHVQRAEELRSVIAASVRQAGVTPEFRRAVDQLAGRWPELDTKLSEYSEAELYRRWLRMIHFRLIGTLNAKPLAASADGNDAAYRHPEQLLSDVALMKTSLLENKAGSVVKSFLEPWEDLIHTFGFHFARMDVRQDSQLHLQAIAEVFKAGGLHEDFSSLSYQERQELLLKSLDSSVPLDDEGYSPATQEVLSLFRLLATVFRSSGPEAIGGYIISMTHHAADLLTVFWLWRAVWKLTAEVKDVAVPFLPVVPLFETIGDLVHGPEILDRMLALPPYRDYISQQKSPAQMVMVGYSDSTKDGGYLAACWHLHRAQQQLAEVAEKHHVRLIVFHGRGGALGRGGGPAARAIRSLPVRAVRGAMRVTEQGEVLAERYDDPAIAHRHLEQLLWATLPTGGAEPPELPAVWTEAMDRMSQLSQQHYRSLVESPGFLQYFDRATPIGEIETLPIGSRPARRRERKSLADLRAIPWTFAWTQSRQIIPAWYGLGTALRTFVDERGGDWTLLQEMYRQWPMFQATIDNAELALAKADMGIAQHYAGLDEHTVGQQAIWHAIRDEYERSRGVVLIVTGQNELLSKTVWLQSSIRNRNPYVDPLNLIQTHLLQIKRTEEPDIEPGSTLLARLVRLTIHGIAAGLRTTG